MRLTMHVGRTNPILRVTVEPNCPKDLPKLVEGIMCLAKVDSFTDCITEDSGVHSIVASGQYNLEKSLKILEEDIVSTIPLKISEPIVSYRETVSEKSSEVCIAKSPNKWDRLYCQALPLNDGLTLDIDKKTLIMRVQATNPVGVKWMRRMYGKNVAVGPETNGPNLLVDSTKCVQQYMSEIKESVVAGFKWATKEGVLCNEMCRGIRFEIQDVTLCSDAIHRGGGQIIPTARRVFHASILTAKPRILEPIYLCEIKCLQDDIARIYEILNKRRGYVIGENQDDHISTCLIKCCIPVSESFDLTADLKSNTEGRAYHHCTFGHWELVPGDPTETATSNRAASIVKEIRKCKGLSEGTPPLDRFLDKI